MRCAGLLLGIKITRIFDLAEFYNVEKILRKSFKYKNNIIKTLMNINVYLSKKIKIKKPIKLFSNNWKRELDDNINYTISYMAFFIRKLSLLKYSPLLRLSELIHDPSHS